jgi:uncharacterized protein
VLSTSACGSAKTILWSCTEGKFNWYYDLDETIVILEGTIVLQGDDMLPKQYGAGDVIYFRVGAHAIWHVEGYVKKIAFLRLNNPFPLDVAVRALNKLRSVLSRNGPVMAAAIIAVAG